MNEFDCTPEISDAIEPPIPATVNYSGISTLTLTDAERAALTAPLDPDDLDILPSGEVYPSQTVIRARLNDVFGPCSWALMPRGPLVKDENTIVRDYALFVRGAFVSEATGEMTLRTSDRMSRATAAEGAKSNALKRCCKDLGIGAECFDKRKNAAWIAEHAVRVWRTKKRGRNNTEGGWEWRRIDAAPFYDEQGSSASQPTMEPQRASAAAAPQTQAAPRAQSPAAPQTQPESVTQSGANTADFTVLQKSQKDYSKPDKPNNFRYGFKLRSVKTGREEWMNTWSASIAEMLSPIVGTTAVISASFEKTQYGYELKSATIIGSQAASSAHQPIDDGDLPY